MKLFKWLESLFEAPKHLSDEEKEEWYEAQAQILMDDFYWRNI